MRYLSPVCRALLLDLAAALLPGLGKQEIGLLFSAIKPAFQVHQCLNTSLFV